MNSVVCLCYHDMALTDRLPVPDPGDGRQKELIRSCDSFGPAVATRANRK